MSTHQGSAKRATSKPDSSKPLASESSQVRVKTELSVWQEVRKGLQCAEEASRSKNNLELKGFILDARIAYQNALKLLAESGVTILDPDIESKMKKLQAFLRASEVLMALLLVDNQDN